MQDNRGLYLLLVPSVILLLLFSYKPMYGVIIAFKDFTPSKGIWGSEWVGFKHFIKFFNSYQFTSSLKNTLTLSIYAWYWEQSLRDFGPKYVTDELNDKLHLSTESGDGLKLELAKMGDDYIGTPFPAVMYTSEEMEEIATIETDTSKYIEEMQALWITDNSHDVDAEWDQYIEQLKAMKFDRLIEIKTNAYNRYIGK